jgi:hypothetical protein
MKLREIAYALAFVMAGTWAVLSWGAGKMCGPGMIGVPVFGGGIYCVAAERWHESRGDR